MINYKVYIMITFLFIKSEISAEPVFSQKAKKHFSDNKKKYIFGAIALVVALYRNVLFNLWDKCFAGKGGVDVKKNSLDEIPEFLRDNEPEYSIDEIIENNKKVWEDIPFQELYKKKKETEKELIKIVLRNQAEKKKIEQSDMPEAVAISTAQKNIEIFDQQLNDTWDALLVKYIAQERIMGHEPVLFLGMKLPRGTQLEATLDMMASEEILEEKAKFQVLNNKVKALHNELKKAVDDFENAYKENNKQSIQQEEEQRKEFRFDLELYLNNKAKQNLK